MEVEVVGRGAPVRGSRFSRTIQRFPVTFALSAPYISLILPMAIWNGNPSTGFILTTAVIAVGGAFGFELLANMFGKRDRPIVSTVDSYGRALHRVGAWALVIGSAAGMTAASAGVGSVQAQVGLTTVAGGPLISIASLISGWGLIGFGLLLASYLGGRTTRRELALFAVILVGAQAVEAYFTALASPLISISTALATLLLLTKAVRIRLIVVAVIIVLLAWPAAFEIRNQLRADSGVSVSATIGAYDRLRFDEQIARADGVQGLGIESPDLIQVLRYGVIPRVLDPDRPPISTGIAINVALGGTATSAYSFLPVATIYVLEGPLYLFLWYFGLALIVLVVWRNGRRVTPTRIVVLTLLVSGPLGWFATYPDQTIGTIQAIVSSIPLFLLLAVVRKRRRDDVAAAVADNRALGRLTP